MKMITSTDVLITLSVNTSVFPGVQVKTEDMIINQREVKKSREKK